MLELLATQARFLGAEYFRCVLDAWLVSTNKRLQWDKMTDADGGGGVLTLCAPLQRMAAKDRRSSRRRNQSSMSALEEGIGAARSADMRTARSLALALSLAGCMGASDFEGAATSRVAVEFHCAARDIHIHPRADLGPWVMDIDACGKRLRYACVNQNKTRDITCIREPDPSP